jgi:hypothetical protein
MAKAISTVLPEIVSALQGSRTGLAAGLGAAAALVGFSSQQDEEEKVP